MNKIILFFTLFLFALTPCVKAQEGKPVPDKDKVNLYDNSGKAHGMWVVQTPAKRGEPASSAFGNFEHGKKLGIWYKINREGDLMSMESFRNDLLDGDAKYYDEKGRLYCTGVYKALNPHRQFDTIVVVDPITHAESYRVIASEYGSVRHGAWKYYDPMSGKLQREDEYQADELVHSQTYAMVADSTLMKKREESLPHKKRTKTLTPPGKRISYTGN